MAEFSGKVAIVAGGANGWGINICNDTAAEGPPLYGGYGSKR